MTVRLLIFCACIGLANLTHAQIAFFKSIKAQSLSVSRTTQRGNFRDPGFDSFSNKARFGELFDDPGAYTWYGDWSDASLDIVMNFRFKDSARYKHEFLAGIQNVSQKVFWLQSNQIPYTSYKGRSEWMKFQIGYKYYVLKRKRIMLSTGLTADIGFTVSSFTKENSGYNQNEFFGWKRGQGSINSPIMVSLRVFKQAFLTVGPTYGVGYRTQDGVGQVIFNKGFATGFRFNI